MSGLSKEIRLVAVAPSYNNARTVSDVLSKLSAQGIHTIAIDDGSTDGAAQAILTWSQSGPNRSIRTHALNQGKAAALRTGFHAARELGYTHALTIDTDAQHDPDDIPPLIQQALLNPHTIIVGARAIAPDYPRRSLLGRLLSNALVWILGGVKVSDSQSGMRIYPLDIVKHLGAKTSRYAFETEVLARAGWAWVDVVEVPIRCIYNVTGGRVTHFCAWRDTSSAVKMHFCLLTRSLLPRTVEKLGTNEDAGTIFERTLRWFNPLRTWRRVRIDPAERERLAASLGWGVFMAYQPFFGLKTLICLALSKRFRLQPLVVLATSSLCTPPVGALLWGMSISVGQVLLHGSFIGIRSYDWHTGPLSVLRQLALEWFLGALLCGTSLGLLTYLLARTTARKIHLPSPQSPKTKPS